MSDSVRNLINSISAGSAIDTEESFNAVMAEKISIKLDAMRQDVATNMFATEEVEIEESEQIDELSKDTLRSYNKKASKQVNSSDRSMEAHYDSHADTSDGDEAPTGQSKTYMKHYKRQVKRIAGMDKADAKIAQK
jgi:hypothetical protein